MVTVHLYKNICPTELTASERGVHISTTSSTYILSLFSNFLFQQIYDIICTLAINFLTIYVLEIHENRKMIQIIAYLTVKLVT